MAIISDITNRVELDRQLLERSKYLEALLRDAPDAIITLDNNRCICEWNPEATRLFGYTPEEVRGKNIDDLITKNDITEEAQHFTKKILNGGDVLPKTSIRYRKDGTPVQVMVSGSPILQEGELTGIVAVYKDISELKKAETELQRTQQDLEALFRSIDDMVIVIDRNYQIVKANNTTQRWLNVDSEDQITGKKCHQAFHNLDEVCSDCPSAQAFETGTPYHIDKFNTKLNKYLHVSASPRLDQDGNVVEVIEIASDTTDKKSAENALRDSEEKFRLIVENSQDIVMLTQPDGIISYLSPACEKVLGYDADSLIGKQPWIIHPEDLEKAKELHYRALQGESGSGYEYRIITKNEKTKWVSHTWSPLFKEGELHGIVSVVRDINKRRLAEIALQESEAKYRMLAEIASELGQCVAIIQNVGDRFGVLRYVNDAVCKLLGYSREELLNMSFADLVAPSQLAQMKENYVRRQNGKEVSPRYEIILKDKDGHQILIEAMLKILDYEGEVATIAFFKDITQQRSLEEQLKQSQKLEAIGLLASGIAHNINAPLSAIIGFAELMQLTNSESRELKSIRTQAHRIKDIVNNMMMKSRRDQEEELTEVCLNNLLKTELSFFEANLHFKHNIEKEFNFDENLPKIKGVYSDFSQSLLNIIGNATDAMYNSEKKKLSVNTYFVNNKIHIEVKDTGEGIPEENIPRLKDPFFTTKPKRGDQMPNVPIGTGLGLYSTHNLLSKYNAEIKIESEVGAGSTFTVVLPIDNNN